MYKFLVFFVVKLCPGELLTRTLSPFNYAAMLGIAGVAIGFAVASADRIILHGAWCAGYFRPVDTTIGTGFTGGTCEY